MATTYMYVYYMCNLLIATFSFLSTRLHIFGPYVDTRECHELLRGKFAEKMIEMESLRLYFRIVLFVISDAFDVILSGGHSGVQLIITYFLKLLDYAERTFAYFLTENLGQIVGPLLCALSASFSRYIF